MENNVNFGEIVIFDHKVYKKLRAFFQILSPRWGCCQKIVSGVWFLNKKFSGHGVSLGGGGYQSRLIPVLPIWPRRGFGVVVATPSLNLNHCLSYLLFIVDL